MSFCSASADQNHKAIANFLPGLQKILSYCFIRLRKRLKKGYSKRFILIEVKGTTCFCSRSIWKKVNSFGRRSNKQACLPLAGVAALVAVVMNLLYKSREENEVLTFWCFCVKTKAHKDVYGKQTMLFVTLFCLDSYWKASVNYVIKSYLIT